MDWRDRIVSDPDVIGGKPRVKGTRLGVVFLLELFAGGWTAEQVLENYPRLTPEDLKAVFAFATEIADEVSLFEFGQRAAIGPHRCSLPCRSASSATSTSR